MFGTRLSDRNNKETKFEINNQILRGAQNSGVLLLTNRGLSRVPSIVWTLNTPLPPEEKVINFKCSGDGARWWETQPIQRLNLSANTITEIPGDGLRKLNSLVTLDVRDNALTTVPEEICELVELKQLFLNCNKIASLPDTFLRLESLVLLEVSHNLLEAFPSGLQSLSALEKLDISDNKLVQLPANLPPRLIFLNVNNNQLERLPDGLLQSFQNLREFNASKNCLRDVGILNPETAVDSALTVLNLHNNQLAELPRLNAFLRLKEVTLGDNKIDRIAASHLQGLSDLTTLDLGRNKISSLPQTLPALLPALARLDMSNNDLTRIPTDFGFMETLNVLSISGNPLRSIGQTVLTSGTQALKALLRDRHDPDKQEEEDCSTDPVRRCPHQKDRVTKSGHSGDFGCNLSAVSATSILDWSGRNVGVSVSRFSTAPIKALKDEIPLDDTTVWFAVAFKGTGSTAIVRDVKLSSRQLEAFPMGVTAFHDTLVSLNLSQNRLVELPEDILHLSKLEELNVSKNALRSLPAALTSMAALQTLVLDFNASLGPQLPLDIIFAPPLCRHLRNLSARGCKLASLPSARAHLMPEKMPLLQNLDVSENDISAIEPELGLCVQIQTLGLAGNTFRVPRPTIVSKGTSAVMEYLRSRIATQ